MLADSYYVTRLEFAYSLLVLGASIAALFSINIYLAAIIILSTVCPILASVAQGKAVEKRTNLYTAALEKLNVMIANLINGYPTLKINHAESAYLRALEQENESTARAAAAQEGVKVRVNAVIGLLAYAGEAVMVGFSLYEISKGRLTVGALVGALQLSEMLAIPTNSIAYQISEMKSVRSIREKIEQMPSAPQPSDAPQKLALARVLLADKRVILLDEAMANMDKESSQNILSRLLQTPELTVISIEHKVVPETLAMYDTVLELKNLHLEEIE